MKAGWLDIAPALAALEALRAALADLENQALSTEQAEAMQDATSALGSIELAIRDAAPPPGEHPVERRRQRQSGGKGVAGAHNGSASPK